MMLLNQGLGFICSSLYRDMPERLSGGQSISWQSLFDNERLEIKRIGIMKIISMKYLKAIWEFCSYLFVPQWGRKTEH